MTEIYEVNGKKYRVSEKGLQKFLNDFPNAVKVQDQEQDKQEEENVNWFGQTWFGRGFEAASTTGEATDLMSQDFSNINEEVVKSFIEAKQQESKTYQASKAMQEFQKQYIKEGKTWAAFFRGVRKNPKLLPELFIQSIGTQIGTLADSPGATLAAVGAGVATGAGAGATTFTPFGVAAGAIAGGFGGLATSMEASLTFGELIETRLKEKGLEFTDENIVELLKTEGKEIRNKAIGRGLTIGAVEGLSGGIAGKVAVATKGAVKGAKRASLAAAASGIGVEAAGGAIGEIGGRAVAGQEMDAAEIGFEAITGTTTAPINVGAALLTAKKPTYRLNGEKVTYEQMKDFVDTADDVDIAKADIQIRDDYTGVGDRAKEKQEAAEKMIELSGDEATIQEVEKAKDENVIKATVELLKQGKQIGNVKDAFAVENNEEAQAAFKKLQDQYGKDVIKDQDVTDADGFFVPTPDGNVAIINKAVAIESGQINVGGHELLHAITQKFYNSLDDAGKRKFIGDFKKTLSKNSFNYIENIINERNKAGENLPLDTTDEWLNIYSDGIVKEEITYDESVITKIRNFLHNIFRKFGYNKEFTSGIATYNFMRDYNKNITEFNKISERALAVAGETTVGTDVKGSITPGFKTDLTDAQKEEKIIDIGRKNEFGDDLEGENGNAMWKAVEGDGAARRIQEEGLLDGLILSQYKKYKTKLDEINVNKNTFLNTTYTELLSHIRNYKPERKNPNGLFGWINPQLGKKSLQAFNVLMKGKEKAPTVDVGQTTKEGDIKVQVAADKDVAMQKLETEDLSPAAQARKKAEQAKAKIQKTSKFRKALGIETGSEIYNRILDSVEKSLITAYAKTESIIDVNERVDKIVEMIRKEYTTKGDFTPIFKNIRDLLSEGNYINNLKEYKDIFINEIKTADLVQMLRESPENEQFGLKFIKKLTSKPEVEHYVKLGLLPKDSLNKIDKGQAVNLYEKTKPTDEKIVAFADKPPINPETGKRSGLKGTRKNNFARRFQQIMIDDAIMQVRQSETFKSKVDEKVKVDNDVEALAAAVDKDPSVKFCKAIGIKQKFKAKDAKVVNILKQIIEKQEANKDYINVKAEKDDIIIKINENLNKIIDQGESLTKSDQDIIAKLAYAITIDRRYSRPTDDKLFNYLLKKIVAAKRKNKKLNAGMAYQQEVEKMFKKFFPRTFKVLSGKGFKGDIYVKLAKSSLTFGFETKLGLAQAVSQYISFTKDGTSFPNPNATINEKTEKTYDQEIADIITNKVQKKINKHLKDLNIDIIEDFSKPLTYEQYLAIQPFKKIFFETHAVNDKYVRWHYGNGKYKKTNSTQGVMIFENKMYQLIEEGHHGDFVQKFNEKNPNNKIPLFQLKEGKNIIVGIGLDFAINKQGKILLKSRIRPLLNSRDVVESKADITKEGVVNSIKQSIEEVSFSRSKNTNGTNYSKAVAKARTPIKYSKSPRGMSTFDFDETLIDKGENFIVAKKGDNTIRISSGQWPIEGPSLAEQGYEFDFSDFINVRGGVEGPLLQKMRNQIKKFGSSNVFVLTARPPQSAEAIHGWLKSKGINIPLENITGLGNSTGEAKAMWMLEKFSEGYNDMYFVDDALPNVKAVKNILDQLDIKSKVVQAKVKFSKSINKDFNNILEDVTGIDSKKRFSDAKARKRGQGKGRFRFFVPPSHEDFVGILYNFIGKGEKGNKHRDFFEKALIKPLNRAYRELNQAKQTIANDYRNLIKQMPDVRKKLIQKTPDNDFTYGDAVRVYLWDKAGFDIPGLSKTDKQKLIDLVNSDQKLKAFADKTGEISRIDEGYIEPSEHWIAGDIRQDLADATGRVGRKKFFAEFIENADIIFSPENINKIRAAFGDNFVEALQDVLYRTKTGVNRKQGSKENRQVNSFLDYLNGSIGATMFFNARSAVLQTLSTVNFINFADNNIFKAAAAFANQKQFWSDFAMLFNSDFLKQRRAGVGFDVNGAEIASAVAKSKEPVKAAIAYILQKGFLPTQLADSFAIALGGASMYRNRVNTYKSQGLSQKEAETKAFEDFQAVAEATQQSARPDMISQQQASVLGRMILAFQNVTSQYVRLIKKAGLDLINRRKTPPYDSQVKSDMSNISKIIYYGAVQNLIFYGLQSALFAMAFEDDQEEDKKNEKFFKTKKQRLLNGSIDSILRGMGVGGAIISVLKNAVIKYGEQQEKGWGKKLGVISDELLQLSPPIGIKLRKLDSFERTMEYNKKVIPEMETFDIDNPMWDAYSNLVEGLTNVPVARLLRKVENVRSALDSENAWWQRVALGLGWSKWELGIEDKEVKEVKEQIKKTNKRVNRDTKSGKRKFPTRSFK